MTFERTAEESDVTLVDAPAGGRSPPYQPTTLPVPVQAIIKGTTKAELLPPANAAMSETKESKTETTPLGAVGPKRGRRRGRQPENQKLPAEVAKAGRMLSSERMRIVLDSLMEVPMPKRAFIAKHLNIGSGAARPATPDTTSSGKAWNGDFTNTAHQRSKRQTIAFARPCGKVQWVLSPRPMRTETLL
jgi:hypothetical protein